MVFEFKISLTAKKSIIEEIEIPKLLIALIEVTYVESKYMSLDDSKKPTNCSNWIDAVHNVLIGLIFLSNSR